MNTLLISILVSLPTIFTTTLKADECAMTAGKYGKSIQYQDMLCRILVTADRTDSKSFRSLTFNNDGAIQVFSNYTNGAKEANGARVFYIFPLNKKKEISEISSEQLVVDHQSGAKFTFDKNGRVSSPNLNMSFSKGINGQNKGGMEIENYSKGLVVDMGYKAFGTPLLNASNPVVVTDKNNKKCNIVNSDLNIVTKENVKPRYKTNEALHSFFAKKCPGLDISDLIKPFKKDLEVVTKPSTVGAAPKVEEDIKISDESRKDKETVDDMEALVEEINSTSR